MGDKMIRIGTWNVSEGVSASWNLNDGIGESNSFAETDLIKQIVKKINDYDLDIVCFQEFPVRINEKEILKEYIFNNTKMKYCTMHSTSESFLFKGGAVGVATFSKYDISYEEKLYFENPNLTKVSKTGIVYKSFDKGIILSRISIGEEKINVITGHAIAFGPFGKDAEDFPQSYKPLAELIKDANSGGEPLIVCGDFNTDELFELIPEIKEIVKDIIEGPTTPPNFESDTNKDGNKLDYILINNLIENMGVQKIENLSDHYLCVADVKTINT